MNQRRVRTSIRLVNPWCTEVIPALSYVITEHVILKNHKAKCFVGVNRNRYQYLESVAPITSLMFKVFYNPLGLVISTPINSGKPG